MDFLKIAGKEIKNIFQNKFIRIALIALLGVPILYSLLYLSAFWDPYGKVKDFPVAVVNLDKGTTVANEDMNLGEEIVNEFKESKDMDWHFTDEEDADKGLEGKKYFVKILIPEDFSKKLVSAKDGTPLVANLDITTNPKKNYMGAQIGGQLVTKLKESITENITKTYVQTAFDSLFSAKDGFKSASEGSAKLNDGLGFINKSTPKLAKGVGDLGKGSGDLLEGQDKLNSSIGQVSGGLKEVNDQIPVLGDGVDKLFNGSNDLKNGLQIAGNGSNQLSDGSKKLYSAFKSDIYPAVNELKKGANELNDALSSAVGSTADLSKNSASLKSGSDRVSGLSNDIVGGYSQVKKGVDSLAEGSSSSNKVMESVEADLQKAMESGDKKDIESALKKVQAVNEESKNSSQKIIELQHGTEKFDSKLKQYNSGVQDYTGSVTKYASATGSLAGNIGDIGKGVGQISNGLNLLDKGLDEKNKDSFGSGLKAVSENMDNLNKGINKLAPGAGQINGGLGELKSNVPTLQKGIGALYTGSSMLGDGSDKLLNGQKKLNSGVKQIGDNIPGLQDGVTKLFDGSKELSEKLGEGASEMESGLKNPSETMANFVKKPIDVESKKINPVDNYGTVFAPYILPLSLWVGALLICMVISVKTDKSITNSKFHTVLGKFLGFGFVGTAQAILTGLTVIALGLKPTNTPLFFLLLIFFSLVFISMMYCLISLFGQVGQLLVTIFMMLQLTGSAGTFPIELAPNFFKVIHPFLPFTYVIETLREVISATTINYSLIGKDVLVLTIVAVVFLGIAMVFKSQADRLQDSIEEKKNLTEKIASSMKA